jgi:GT2 family glycosyltransferase
MIQNFSIIDKIVIVDNDSSDESFHRLIPFKSDKIDVIKTEHNKGYAYGNNFGVAFAEKHYKPQNIIISNPDIIIKEESIVKIIDVLNSNENVAIATGIIHDNSGSIISNFAWKVPTYYDMLINCFFIAYKFHRKILKKGMFYDYKILQQSDFIEVEVVSGCFFIIKDNIFQKINGFDEETFLFNEENIIGFKLKEQNLKVCLVKDSTIIHNTSTSINKNIKSIAIKENILKESSKTYIRKYLKVGAIKLLLFKLAFNLGKYEKRLIKIFLSSKYGSK